jgi:hypothetical protein
MSTTLKERVEVLEKQVEELAALVRRQAGGQVPRAKDWRRTIGTAADDPGFDEMVELGREIRRKTK